MAYSLKEAAEAVGRGKPAILKAIQNGKISAKKDDHGEWQIEPAELHRVYPPVSETVDETAQKETQATIRNSQSEDGNTFGNKLLEQELQFLREKLADVQRLGEDEKRSLNARIEDLRRDRDDLREERDKLLKVIDEQAGSMRLLSDQRTPSEPASQPQKSGFFGLFRRRG